MFTPLGPIKNTDAMNFSGSGALQNASLKMPSLTKPVNVHNANMQFTQNSVNLTNLSASLGSTNANGNLSIANFAGSAADVSRFRPTS